MTTHPHPRPPRSRAEAERSRLRDEYEREIDRLAAGFHARLPREQAQAVGAIYARYSSRYQDSIADQVRTLFEFAVADRIFVPRQLVFFDAAVRGAKARRPGLDRLRPILERKAIDVLLVFSTNRLSRRMVRALQFVEEEVHERGIRCVFVKDRLDTADGDRWRLPLRVHAMTDELVGGMYAENIRAAHEGLFDRDLVWGTITFGYRGCELPEQSRRQRPRRAVEIDPAAAPWVKQAFRWYAEDRLSIGAIVRRFNGDPTIPRSPRGVDGRWSREAIRYMLANPRYRGWWEYGARANVFQSKQDYTRRVPRDQPLRSRQSEALRIVPDELWYRVQRRLTRPDRSGVGRKPRGGDRRSRPRLTHGLFVCPAHDQILYVGGNHGQTLYCKMCSQLSAAERPLYSHLPRSLALRLTCRKLGALVRQDAQVVEAVLDACRGAAEDLQRPDPAKLEGLRSRTAKLGRQIQFILDNPGETESDCQESRVRLRELRRQRADLDAEITALEAAGTRSVVVPDEARVRELLARFETILTSAAEGEDEVDSREVRGVIDLLTGGRIELFQRGEPRARRGWLQGRFRAHVLDSLVRTLAGATADDGRDAPVISIDYREPTLSEAWADHVKELFDQGMLIKAIAAELGISRNVAASALDCWYDQRGLPRPDGRSRRSTLKQKHLKPPLFEQLADEAMALHDAGHTMEEIASRLNCCRPTIAKAIGHGQQSRGLSLPDGRTRPIAAGQGRPRPEPQGGGLEPSPPAA
jgi:DNA invertase Pin-like site-specific DNA recombinase